MNKKNRRLNEPRELGAQVYMVIAPDGGYGWLVVLASFTSNCLVDGVGFSYSIYMEVLQKVLNVSLTQISLIPSIMMGLYLMCGPFFSALVNRFGFRRVAFGGGLLASLGYLSTSFVDSFEAHLFFNGVIAGIGSGMVYAPSVIIIGYYFEKYRALATGIAVCGSAFGTLVFSHVLVIFMERYDWRWTMRLQALLVLIASMISLSFAEVEPTLVEVNRDSDFGHEPMPIERAEMDSPSIAMTEAEYKSKFQDFELVHRTPRRSMFACCRKNEPTPLKTFQTGILQKQNIFYGGSLENVTRIAYESSKMNVTRGEPSVIFRDVAQPTKRNKWSTQSKRMLLMLVDVSLLRSPSFICILLALFFQGMTIMIPYLFLRSRAEHNNLPKQTAEMLVAYLSIGNLVGRMSGGFSSFVPVISVETILSTSCHVGGICICVSAFYGEASSEFQIVFSIVIGFTSAFFQTLRTIVIVKCMGLEKLTNAFGLSTLVMGAAALIGNPIVGALKEHTGKYQMPFLWYGMLTITAGCFWMVLPWVHAWEIKRSANK